MCWTHTSFASAQEEEALPEAVAPSNPLPLVDTLKTALEEMCDCAEESVSVVVQRKRRSLASVRSEHHDLKEFLTKAQERLDLLLAQKSAIAPLVSAYAEALNEVEDSDDEEADALRAIIQGVYAEAGVTSRQVLENQLKEQRAQVNTLKQKTAAREALLKGHTFVPTSQEAVLAYLKDSQKHTLDLGNPATLGAITKILRDVYCIE